MNTPASKPLSGKTSATAQKSVHPLADLARDLRGGFAAAFSALPSEVNRGLLAIAALSTLGVGHAFIIALIPCLALSITRLMRGTLPVLHSGTQPTLVVLTAAFIVAANAAIPKLTAYQLLVLSGLVVALAGLMQWVLAKFGLAPLVRYVPYPVQLGIKNAAAILILLFALKLWIGLGEGSGPTAAGNSADSLKRLLLESVVVGIAIVTIILAERVTAPRRLAWLQVLPSAVLGMLVAIGVRQVFVANGQLPAFAGGRATGVAEHAQLMQQGWHDLLKVNLDQAGFTLVVLMMSYAVAMALLASLEGLLTTDMADAERDSFHTPARELQSFGLGNFLSGLAGGLAGAPILTRVVMSVRAGASSKLTDFAYAATIVVAMLLVPAIAGRIPTAVFVGVLIGVGWTLFDLGPVWRWFNPSAADSSTQRLQSRMNAWIAIMVAFVAVVFGLLQGMALGLVCAAGLVFFAQSKSIVRGFSTGMTTRSLKARAPAADEWLAAHGDRICVVHIRGILFFGTSDPVRRALEDALESAKLVVVDMRHVLEVDASGVRALELASRRANKRGATLMLAGVAQEGVLERGLLLHGLDRTLRRSLWFPTLDFAMESCENALLLQQKANLNPIFSVALENSTLAQELTPLEIAFFKKVLQPCNFGLHERVFGVGDPGDCLYVIVEGSVDIVGGDSMAHGQRVASFAPGTVLGEMALLDEAPRSATAIAMNDVQTLKLSSEAMQNLMLDHPQVAAKIYANLARIMSQRVRSTTMALIRESSA